MNTSWAGDRTGFPPATRAAILRRDPVCVECGLRSSTIADHEPNYRTLIRMGVVDPHAIEYGQGMCTMCHDEKTRREQAAGKALRLRPPRQHPGRA